MNKHFSLKLIGNLTMALVSQKFSNDNDSHDKLYFFSSKVFNPIKRISARAEQADSEVSPSVQKNCRSGVFVKNKNETKCKVFELPKFKRADFSERWEIFSIENQEKYLSLEVFDNNPKYEMFSKLSVKRLFSKAIFKKNDRKWLFELQYTPSILFGFMAEKKTYQDVSIEFTVLGLSICFFNIEENEIF